MKYLLSLGLVLLLSNPFESFAQDMMYSKEEFLNKLTVVKEVQVNLQGYDYNYAGTWLQTMTIENEHTLTFTRGRVVHSYDLSKLTFLQEEGGYVRLWFR